MKIILSLPYVSPALWFSPLFLSPFPVLLCLLLSICISLSSTHFLWVSSPPPPRLHLLQRSAVKLTRDYTRGESRQQIVWHCRVLKRMPRCQGGAQRRGRSSPVQPPQAGEAAASHLLEQVPLLAAELLGAAVQQPGWQPVGPCRGRLAMQQWAGC